MEELDVMVRTGGEIPRPRTGADRRRRRTRRRVPVARRSGPGTATVTPLAPRRRVCVPGPDTAGAPGAVPVPVLPAAIAGAAAVPERAPRTRACLVPARTAGHRTRGHRVRTRTERFLVGLATVLCSAVAVVVLGLLADASAGRVDAPGVGVPSPEPGYSAPAWSVPSPGSDGVVPSGVGSSR
ncbi:hypothetical protein EV383_1736 [Pseudonocardia sediminis]|uniref:Uncharacterized protein n=1 Tax=Pseudonocardia sediminis TaxID=1397368 RepID=A0A4Q7UXL5_PSEST|nr:hypothetical protein [Pseudonocardia sediminis]RZT84879.1 hypothetical protein EV383_1736 [Pseudonocardia sediminis]